MLKLDRLSVIKKKYPKMFIFHKSNINSINFMQKIFIKYKFDIVIHLAAQAGVRYSLINPKAYVQSNIVGFHNILELSKNNNIKHLVFASSSSVYGESKEYPLKENNSADKPIQLYAATKRTNELFAHTYSHLYKLKITALRFFTVYGPWGRPDMSLYKFVKNILRDQPIEIYNNGDHIRDFTYIDDIVNGIRIAALNKDNKKLFKIFNIGSNKPIKLSSYIDIIEKKLNKKSIRKYMDIQKGDIHKTHASIKLIKKIGFNPKGTIKEGVSNFVDWYLSYYKKK